ncbi:MAG: hypothetical protein ACREIU_03910 [Planctomycetota bacterium]
MTGTRPGDLLEQGRSHVWNSRGFVEIASAEESGFKKGAHRQFRGPVHPSSVALPRNDG